jgi:predicted ATP-binding protein involved in virulence
MNIESLRLVNFKCFEDRTFSFGSRFNLIIGDNAMGKTTLLDGLSVGVGALFLAFPSPATPRKIRRNEARLRFFRHGDTWTAETQFPVIVECAGKVDGEHGQWSRGLGSKGDRAKRPDTSWIRETSSEIAARVKQGKPTTLPIVSYYGTGRLWEQLSERKVKTLKPDTRFMGYRDCLNPASDVKRLLQWFKTQELSVLQRRARNTTLEAVRRAILNCVREAERVEFDVARDELMIQFKRRSLPLASLSDGFRNMVAMAADIAVRCATLNPQLKQHAAKSTPGIVLIDEVDLHLHPRWQRRVVEDLLRTFPRIQFFGTTHSPFIIQSLRPIEGIQLLNLDNPAAEEFSNKSVEDITEEVQGVELPQRSKRFIEMMDAAERYFATLRESSEATPSEREAMKKRLDELSMPYSDDPAYQAFLKMQRAASGIDGDGQ